MKKRSFILGLVFLMFVSSVVYPNRVKDTEQSWEEEEDRSIISSPTLSIDENNIYIHSNKLLDGLNVKIINIKGNVLYNDIITVSSEIEYPISIDFLLNGDYKGSPDKPGGLSIQLCKSEKKEFYIRYSS